MRVPGAIWAHFGPKKWIFIRILRFIWDPGLVLFDSSEDLVFGKVSVFGNISPLFWCKNWGVTQEGVKDKPLKMSQIISFLTEF